jgi:lipoprotein signal peptidase
MILMLPGWHWAGTWTLPLLDYPGPGRDVFPWIFNVADSLLCAGVGLMVVYNFFQPVGKNEDVKRGCDEGAEANRHEGT